MEEKKLTQEELFEAEAYFNMATLLGKSIQAAAYDIAHPGHESERIVWLDKPEAPADDIGDDELDKMEEGLRKAQDSDPVSDNDVIHSSEASVDTQIDQLTALYSPGLMDFLHSASLYDMFRLASAQFSFDEEKLSADILTPADKRKMALAWVIVKRVFAVRHPDETLLIVSATEGAIREAKKITFRPIDEIDKQFIIETCALFSSDFDSDDMDDQKNKTFIAEKLEQLQHSSVISTPTSLAYWRQSEAAATGVRKKTGGKIPFKIPDVYTKPLPVDIELTIADPEGKPVKITGFDMSLQATIGQMYRENGNKPFEATPAQIYRRCAGLDTNASVSPSSIEETIEAINKMAQAKTTILYAQQLEAFLKQKNSSEKKQPDFDYSVSKIEGPLIMSDRKRTAHVAANGKIIDDVFVFYRAPIIEHYSYGFRQLMEIDRKYLGEALNKATPENISFARYLLVQINRIKQNKKDNKIPDREAYSESLTFEKIATRCVYDISTRGKLRNFQKKVFDYCENLVSMNHIKKVEQEYKGRDYIGIRITV